MLFMPEPKEPNFKNPFFNTLMVDMNMGRVYHFIDVLMLAAFILLFSTGIIKFPRLLPTLGIGYGSLPMSQISLVHDYAGVSLGILIIVHFLLHWRWMWGMTKSLFRRGGK